MLLALEVKVLCCTYYYNIECQCLAFYLMLTKKIKSGIYILQHFACVIKVSNVQLQLILHSPQVNPLGPHLLWFLPSYRSSSPLALVRSTFWNDRPLGTIFCSFHPPLFLIANCGFWIFLFELCVVQKPQKDLKHMKENDNDDSLYVISRFSQQLASNCGMNTEIRNHT